MIRLGLLPDNHSWQNGGRRSALKIIRDSKMIIRNDTKSNHYFRGAIVEAFKTFEVEVRARRTPLNSSRVGAGAREQIT